MSRREYLLRNNQVEEEGGRKAITQHHKES